MPLSGIRTTSRPVRGLVSIPIPLFLVVLASINNGRKCVSNLPEGESVFSLCAEESVIINRGRRRRM